MAKRIKKAKNNEAQAEVKPSVKLKEFTLKQDFNGKKPGDKIKLGKIGEQFYKSKNII